MVKQLADVLLVVNLEIVAQVVYIHFKVVDNQRRRGDVCHEVVRVPARHVVGTRRRSVEAQTRGLGWRAHTRYQISS